jgi:hypothetical protein
MFVNCFTETTQVTEGLLLISLGIELGAPTILCQKDKAVAVG